MAIVNYSWNNLPSVVIYDVFELLTDKQDLLNASTTCKSWRSCLFHPKLWPIKSMTIDLVNISAYETKSSNSNYRGHVKKSHYHLKTDPYRRHHYNNNYKNQYYSSRSTTPFLSNNNYQITNRKRQHIETTSKNTSFNYNHLLIKNNSNFYGQNAHLKADYRQFLEKCSRFLTHVCIKFNAYDSRQLVQLIYTINILTRARTRNNQLFNFSTTILNNQKSTNEIDNYFNNIESLILKPIYIKTIDKILNQFNTRTNHHHFNTSSLRIQNNRFNKRNNENLNSELLLKVFDSIEKLISTNRSIKNLSLGCLEELLDCLPSLLNKLKNNVHINDSIETLNVSTIKLDPFYYPVHTVKFTWFTSFKNLIKLSIDYDYVSDDFIIQLAKNCKKLKDLTLNIHGLDKLHPILNQSAWNQFKADDDKTDVELTINLLHTNESPEELKLILQNITIPICAFRAYFAFTSSINNNPLKEIINILSTQQQFNLKQLTLVDELKQNDSGLLIPNKLFSSTEENTLVMLAWRCKNLEELTLIGYELSEIDLLAITRLRGENLKQLLVPDCCIYLMNSKMLEDEGYYDDDKIFLDYATTSIRNQVINEIAKPLNREWTPFYLNQLTNGNNASEYYLNTMLN